MKRLIAGVLAGMLLTACAPGGQPSTGESAPPPPKDAEKVTLTLNWVPYGEHAPFYYGLKKGFYAEEGIALEIKPGSGSGNTIKAVAAGQTTFGWADTPPLLNSVAAGVPVKSAGVFLQKGPASIEFLEGANIKSIKDLKGKRVGGTPGDAMYATFPAVLAANGLQPTDVTVVNMDAANKIAQLTTGGVDAIMGFFHDQGPTIEAKTGKKVEYLLYADTGLNLLGTGIVVGNDTLTSKKELVAKFVRATQKSWAEAVKNADEAAKSMVDLAENEPPLEVLVKQLKLAEPLLKLSEAGKPGKNTEKQWQETIELLNKYGTLKEPKAPSVYWDGSLASGGGA
ncbi:MAG TPA: ABC transporter substrate-binding protein [Actinokineospora sp.]|nr:ABC transporter substrate-binding protein [Actinokineospora sp.]